VRIWAAHALGIMGDQAAVEPLIVCLKDSDPNVQASAATSLGNLKDRRAVQPLISMLKNGGSYTDFTVNALRDLTGMNLGNDARAWQEWWDRNRETGK
jgi:HEAT repeat protein